MIKHGPACGAISGRHEFGMPGNKNRYAEGISYGAF
jgi:hypothetical protein